MPRKQADLCIFCDCSPCECEGAPKKKVSKSSQKKSTPPAPPSAPVVDLKAAMKEAIAPGQAVQISNERVKITEELKKCLNILYPILHEDEIRKHRFLDEPSFRAERWRIRRGRTQ